MRSGSFTVVLVFALLIAVPGCTPGGRLDLSGRTGGNAALFGQFRAYDGHTGRPMSFADVVRRCARADVILFGEEHGAAVCNQLEAQLLGALLCEARPVALAMEFFEADTQADLDAYLRGRLAEDAFRERSRQGRQYALSHRPLIELCRAARAPVVAANAPRRLVSAYRRSGDEYEVFRSDLEPVEQRWLPLRNEYVRGPYEQRFMKIMSGHGRGGRPPMTTQPTPTSAPTSAPATSPTDVAASQPCTQPTTQPVHPPPVSQPVGGPPAGMNPRAFYRAQLLWDQAMAEAVADVRQRDPRRRVMLVVGGFHVAQAGGTVVKLRDLRPRDRLCTVVYEGTPNGAFAFDEQDRGTGDVVIYGMEPPPKKEPPDMPPSMPPSATQPVTTAPTSAPAASVIRARAAKNDDQGL